MTDVELKRIILLNTGVDHYSGVELEKYENKIRTMTDSQLEVEYRETWNTDEVIEQYL